ncbi:MAG: amidase family protein [Pseudomonadota bacterium]
MTNSSFPPTSFTGPDLCAMTASEVVELLKKRAVSPTEVLEACLERIGQVERHINALPTLCADRARAALANLDDADGRDGGHPGWLAGLPVPIKDLTPVAGVRTTWGTPALAAFVPAESAPIVQHLEARGATVIAKSNTPEMGAGGNTVNAVLGQTRNPWNVTRNAGGSSGGAAAALAAGCAWLAHGSDLAGSLRTPAACCGVVGLRPSPGRVAGGPADLAFNHEGVQGPMARTVLDTALFLDAMVGFDPRLPLSLEAPTQSFQESVRSADPPVRIAFAPTLGGFAPVEPEIAEIMQSAVTRFESVGTVVEGACPALADLERTYLVLRGFYWAALPGRMPDKVQEGFNPTLKQNIAFGRNLTTDDLIDAHRNRSRLFLEMHRFLQTYDVVACAVIGPEPGPVEEEYPRRVAGEPVHDYVDWLRFSFLATTTGLPALSLPVGWTQSGLPVGLQLIGPPRGEAKLLAVASVLEDLVGFAQTGPIDPVVPTDEDARP